MQNGIIASGMRSSNSREKSGFLIQVIHGEPECVLQQGREPFQEEVSGMGKKGKSIYGSENSQIHVKLGLEVWDLE